MTTLTEKPISIKIVRHGIPLEVNVFSCAPGTGVGPDGEQYMLGKSEETLAQELRYCDEAEVNIRHFRSQLPMLVRAFSSLLSLRFCFYYPNQSQVILGIRKREDWDVVRALHAGIWRKSQVTADLDPDQEGAAQYEAVVNGVRIDCRVDELPPSCEVVEEIVEVAAHIKLVRRIVCNEPEKETAAKGEIISEEALA